MHIREFVPVEAGRASIYLCGATVQAPPHIGHIRSGVSFDVLRRWLAFADMTSRSAATSPTSTTRSSGSAAEGVPWWAVAERNQRAFTWAYDTLGCLPPDVEPRATGHVPEMIVLMQRLIERGHAYAAGGDVYFDVASYAEYGKLSNQRLDEMRAAADTDDERQARPARLRPVEGRQARASRPGPPPGAPAVPAGTWSARPWPPSTSAPTFDIHGGGLDLVFPHHENELAQSRRPATASPGTGCTTAWVRIGGEKMSKSLGNSLLIPEMVHQVRPVELRYYLGAGALPLRIDYSRGGAARRPRPPTSASRAS